MTPSRREWLVFYYKYRARLLATFWLPVLAFTALSFVPAPLYRADSVLIVRLGSEYVYQPEVTANRNVTASAIPFDREQIFKSEVAILGSRDLHEQTIKAIGLHKIYPELFEPGLAAQAAGRINDMDFGAAEAALAAPRRYLDEAFTEPGDSPVLDRQRLARATDRFEQHLDLLLGKDSAVITLGFEHQNPVIAAQALNTLLKLYMEKRRELYMEPRVELAQTQTDAARTRAQAANQAIEDFKRKHKIYALADQRGALLQARIEVDKQMAVVSSPSLQARQAFFTRQLDVLDAQERELSGLQHEAKIADEDYAFFSHKLAEARAFEALQHERAGGVRIIQPPAARAEPRNLQPLIILAGLFLGILSALLTAALTEFFGSGFLTPEKLERHVGLPVLAVLPFDKGLRRRA
ncbi:MAG: hypothetical protein SFW62_07160 [Alphaproteobacteria bacterium]|nr:hypothetical protein [Alphaproteobacteria bacterium]